MNENIKGYELGWDDTIENDSPDYILLPIGDYDFTVTALERQRYEPKEGAKLPPCNMAILTLEIECKEGTAHIKHNLYLHSSTEGLLCAFFTAIGQRKHGERSRMNWNAIIGAKGRCKVGIRTYKSKTSGEDVTVNEIKKFYEPVINNEAPTSGTSQGYIPGQF